MLEAGVAVDPVGQGQHVEDVDGLGLRRHVRELAGEAEDGAVLRHALEDLPAHGFGNETCKVGTINKCHVFSPDKVSWFSP